jgi:putative transposase
MTFLRGLPFTTIFQEIPTERALWSLILKALHAAERKRVGKDPQLTAAIMDSQSVKTTEESACPSGYDAHKNVKGRKRHLLVDTLGLPLSIYVTSADVQDRVRAQCLLAGIKVLLPRLKKIWADGAYTGEKLARWCKEHGGWELQIVERSSADTEGFAVLPHRWIVERTLGWLMRNRRLSKDYERKVQTSETLMEVAMIRLILSEAASKASVNLTKQALTLTGRLFVTSPALGRIASRRIAQAPSPLRMARVTICSSPLMALCLRSSVPTPSLCRRVLNCGGRPSESESESLKHIGPGLLAALALPLLPALIHRSVWKWNSANFALTEF